MPPAARPLALVTGASTGIGFELAACCARDGFDLIIASDEPEIASARKVLADEGVLVHAVEADLATKAGVAKLVNEIAGRPVDALLANAGRGLGHTFLDQNLAEAQRVVDTNISGTIALIHHVGNDMRRRGTGRILITGSVAGYIPGSYQAVYNGTKAFLNSFSIALRDELLESGVTVTCLMPGATETEFFRRADLLDTETGRAKKDDARDVAKAGFAAMMKGESDIVYGLKNKLQTAAANVLPSELLAKQYRKQMKPSPAK
jgi:uncharacterized protein